MRQICTSTILALVSCVLMVMASGTAEEVREEEVAKEGGMTIDELATLAVGDYLQFEMNMDEMMSEMAEGMDDENLVSVDTLKVEMGRFEAIGTEKVTVKETEYDAVIVLQDWGIEFSMTFEGGEYNGTVSMKMEMEQKIWWTASRQTVKEETRSIMEMSIPYENDTMTMNSDTVDKATYLTVADPVPLPIQVGSKWTETAKYIENTTGTNYNSMYGWDNESNEETYDEINNYEVTGQESVTTPAGTFDALVVKEPDEWDETSYELTYYMDGLLPVKMSSMENGTEMMAMELKAYSVASLADGGDGHTDGDDDGGDGHTDGDDADIGVPKDDIEGVWTATDQDGDSWDFNFQDDGDFVIETPDGRYEGTYTVDEAADPHTMDMLIDKAPEGDEDYEGQTSKAIYQVDDGNLQIAMGEPGGERPASFDEEGAMSLQGSYVTPPEDGGDGDDDDDDEDTPGFGALMLLGAMGAAAVASIVIRRRK